MALNKRCTIYEIIILVYIDKSHYVKLVGIVINLQKIIKSQSFFIFNTYQNNRCWLENNI